MASIEDMLKNINPQTLANTLNRMEMFLSPEQMKQVKNVIQSANKGELNQKLNTLNSDDLARELKNNPALAKQLAGNPELMNKINQLLK
ncbi:MAG: hypothetical protein IJD36_06280 [Clostridia bacterium]|nr:hypothetical protein [Clostridia bacterium]